jgi:hypothetical protein
VCQDAIDPFPLVFADAVTETSEVTIYSSVEKGGVLKRLEEEVAFLPSVADLVEKFKKGEDGMDKRDDVQAYPG